MFSYQPYTTIGQLVLFTVLAVAMYYLAKVLKKLEWSTVFSETMQTKIRRGLSVFSLVYEPIAILIFLAILVGVRPSILGPIVVVALVIGYNHLRNYLSRSIVMINKSVGLGSYIHSGKVNGRVTKLGRLGMHLQSVEGIHILSYLSLLDKGYTISEGEKISRLYTLHLTPSNNNGVKKQHEIIIKDKLANTPYVDWSTTPEVEASGLDDGHISLKVVLRDKEYIDELVILLEDWGYQSS